MLKPCVLGLLQKKMWWILRQGGLSMVDFNPSAKRWWTSAKISEECNTKNSSKSPNEIPPKTTRFYRFHLHPIFWAGHTIRPQRDPPSSRLDPVLPMLCTFTAGISSLLRRAAVSSRFKDFKSRCTTCEPLKAVLGESSWMECWTFQWWMCGTSNTVNSNKNIWLMGTTMINNDKPRNVDRCSLIWAYIGLAYL